MSSTTNGQWYPPEWPDRIRALTKGELTPAAPRRAATVLLLRDTDAGGPAVHMLRRRASMAFAGGAYAYPGGAVDPRDERPVAWAGPSLSQWAARLGVTPYESYGDAPAGPYAEASAGPYGAAPTGPYGDTPAAPAAGAEPAASSATPSQEAAAQAIVCAAVRETFEEAGVLLAGPSADSVVADTTGEDWEADRAALVARELSFADFLARRGLVLRSDLLGAWARWITPEFEPRRYDTWFFVAVLPEGQRTRNASTEADRTVWMRPGEAAAGYDRGELLMMPPTISTLRGLQPYATAAQALAASGERDLTPVLARAVLKDGEIELSWPGHDEFTKHIAPASGGADSSGPSGSARPARPAEGPAL
ncbi:NUDIX hydrolase [Streptomyces sp. MST-110588]|uniref:NUDIX hydrolase n=1 Tax=Streptomyces sp. MST-110588 TaxID=2833628 RepID=UPI001F5D19D9|nr:NUDIX hydrolase [Streptomyces sp. MST-110588]UNO40702.1 NUDIX hydrolase [Streptomyces sp. MST-110588]